MGQRQVGILVLTRIEVSVRSHFPFRFGYRLPGGESYADLVQRVSPFVLELERLTAPVLVVAHQSVLQVLYAYFKGIPVETAPFYNCTCLNELHA